MDKIDSGASKSKETKTYAPVVCILHPHYEPSVPPPLSCKQCCKRFVADAIAGREIGDKVAPSPVSRRNV